MAVPYDRLNRDLDEVRSKLGSQLGRTDQEELDRIANDSKLFNEGTQSRVLKSDHRTGGTHKTLEGRPIEASMTIGDVVKKLLGFRKR